MSATVIARAILSVDSAPASIEVTRDDIARRYVDVAVPIVIRVRTNSRAGYLLRADAVTADFEKVELSFGDAQMTVSGAETWVNRPYVPGGEVLSLRMRVYLREKMAAGSYPLPITLSTQPL